MMKAQNKNRKHPTCSRCRFHGKKDIRVLQHQCPFRNCTCSSCFLIKRSIIYRAQKNLDKHEDNSNDAESSGGSGDGSALSANFNEMSNKSATCSISRSSDSSSDATNFGATCVSSDGPAINATHQSWEQSSEQVSQNSCLASTSAKSSEHYKISDFQSLCLTFPELTPSQLQTIFEQCGNDFQRTIDRILMTKWCNETDSKANIQFQNNNDWSSTSSSISGDYASNVTSFGRSGLPSSLMLSDGMPTNLYHASNADHCFDWRSNTCSTSNEDYFNPDCGNDYYYDQSFQACGVMSQQGNHQAFSPNWNYDYTPYWYNNSQGSNTSTNTSYDVSNSGSQSIDDTGWHNGQSGQLALGQTMHESNI